MGETRRNEKWDVEGQEEDEESFDDNDIVHKNVFNNALVLGTTR